MSFMFSSSYAWVQIGTLCSSSCRIYRWDQDLSNHLTVFQMLTKANVSVIFDEKCILLKFVLLNNQVSKVNDEKCCDWLESWSNTQRWCLVWFVEVEVGQDVWGSRNTFKLGSCKALAWACVLEKNCACTNHSISGVTEANMLHWFQRTSVTANRRDHSQHRRQILWNRCGQADSGAAEAAAQGGSSDTGMLHMQCYHPQHTWAMCPECAPGLFHWTWWCQVVSESVELALYVKHLLHTPKHRDTWDTHTWDWPSSALHQSEPEIR